MDSLQEIKNLQQVESNSNGTSLVSLYLPSNCNLWLISDHIKKEITVASNIKNKSVRSDVLFALQNILHNLKSLSTVNNRNGFVLCAGKYNLVTNIVEKKDYL